ncbi:MAG: glycosyltransferase 87 family protein [Candidatus Acidiferrales bacterium]
MPQSRTRSFDTRLFLGVVALCIVVSNLALFYAKRDGLAYRDFKIFYSGARILQAYPGTELYNLDLQARVQTELLHIKPKEALPYNHPPFELLLFLPLAGLSYSLAFYLWIAISIACGIVSAKLIGRELPRLREGWRWMPYALVMCLFPFFMVILEGQDSALALLLLVAAWVSMRRGADARGGFWLGLALFKFQVILPLAFILVFWKPKLLKGFSVSAALLGLISLILIRPAGLISYIYLLTGMARASSEGVSLKFGMDPRLIPNLRGLVYGIVSGGGGTLSHSWAAAVIVAVGVISAAVLVWTIRRMAPTHADSLEEFDLAFSLAVIVSLLLSFHILAHDLVLLALPFAIVVDRMMALRAARNARFAGSAILISIFYVYEVYLFLFAWSKVYWLAAALIALAILISNQQAEVETVTADSS